uniref:Uncharacterized protein n=1 Tax=Vitis vinifera TaxID=29760 RepID=A5ARL4_VITVI|nr:hypothetical protein VITISV_014718 [Vitis vinifera]
MRPIPPWLSQEAKGLTAFKALLSATTSNEQLYALGELMYQCHYSYSACGLGSDGTDRSGNGSLYGAKITGGGSGGTVCVIGSNCLRSSQQILEELDLFYESDLGCEDCCLKQKRMIEKEHVFKFLVGLNRELDEVHGRILSRSPFPSINDVFAKVRRKEDRKQVMLGEKTTIKGWLMALPLSHTVYQRTEAMESNGNACGATIATVPGILVTLAGKFTENQQTGH